MTPAAKRTARKYSKAVGQAGPEFWRRAASPWERWEPVLLHTLSQLDPVLLRVLELEPGHRVLDLACGSGDPTISVARWVGPRGRVVGLDIAPSMLAVARRRARLSKLRNVRFKVGDLSLLPASGSRFDRVVSRFGMMFAKDVVDAFRRIRSRLQPGGRVAVAVWGPAERNPGHSARERLLRPLLEAPPRDADTPHPLRLGRRGLLPRLLRDAGFVDVGVEAVPLSWTYPSVADFVQFQIDLPISQEYAQLSAADRRCLREGLSKMARRHQQGGVVRIPGSAWVAWGVRSRRRAR